jgi:hypothetical protein
MVFAHHMVQNALTLASADWPATRKTRSRSQQQEKKTHKEDEQQPVCSEQYHQSLLKVSILITV